VVLFFFSPQTLRNWTHRGKCKRSLLIILIRGLTCQNWLIRGLTYWLDW
jgi:hypothetical protein